MKTYLAIPASFSVLFLNGPYHSNTTEYNRMVYTYHKSFMELWGFRSGHCLKLVSSKDNTQIPIYSQSKELLHHRTIAIPIYMIYSNSEFLTEVNSGTE